MAHELTVQELEKFSADFNKNPENKVIARAAQRSGVLEASYNDRVQSKLTRVFSTELDENQGACQHCPKFCCRTCWHVQSCPRRSCRLVRR